MRPHTWSATTIQFLTQAELRAFFRVITRKRDRALFLIAYRHGLRASEVQPSSEPPLHRCALKPTLPRSHDLEEQQLWGRRGVGHATLG